MAIACNFDVNKLVSNREIFNDFVYTPVNKVLKELEQRKNDAKFAKIINSKLKNKLPLPLQTGPRAVLFRHIATPNYEIRRFLNIAEITHIKPLIFEYTSDLFLSMNKWKYSLAKLPFFKSMSKENKIQVEYKNIIDFNSNNRKPFSGIQTLWGQSLVDFHHEFFLKHFPNLQDSIFDLSGWLKTNGDCSKKYYKSFLSLFLKNAILFENFLLEGEELEFTKKVILPALIDIIKETGYKPLIVALEPTKAEDDLFWLCHPITDKEFIKSKQKPKIIFNKSLASKI